MNLKGQTGLLQLHTIRISMVYPEYGINVKHSKDYISDIAKTDISLLSHTFD